jgi:hypothetical protein
MSDMQPKILLFQCSQPHANIHCCSNGGHSVPSFAVALAAMALSTASYRNFYEP